MTRTRYLLVGTTLVFGVLAACTTNRDDVCVEANNGQSTTVVGYVSFGGFSIISNNQFPVRLVQSMNAEEYILAYVPIGEGPGTIAELPESFSQDDIEITLDDGGTRHFGQRIAITGELSVSGDSYCALRNVSVIAKP